MYNFYIYEKQQKEAHEKEIANMKAQLDKVKHESKIKINFRKNEPAREKLQPSHKPLRSRHD